MLMFQADQDSETDNTTQNPEPAPKKSKTSDEKAFSKLQNS